MYLCDKCGVELSSRSGKKRHQQLCDRFADENENSTEADLYPAKEVQDKFNFDFNSTRERDAIEEASII